MIECLVGNLPGQNLTYGNLTKGNHDVEGHYNFYIFILL